MNINRLETLNHTIRDLTQKGFITEEEYAAFMWLLRWLEFTSAYIGDRVPIREAQKIMGEIK